MVSQTIDGQRTVSGGLGSCRISMMEKMVEFDQGKLMRFRDEEASRHYPYCVCEVMSYTK